MMPMATTSDPSAGFSHDAAVLSKTLKRLISRLALRQAQERLKAKLDEWEMGIF